MATYEYTVATDFPNAKVNPAKLGSEIQAAGIVEYSHTNTEAGVCYVVCTAELTEAQVTLLNELVASHDEAAPPQYKFHASSSLVGMSTEISEVTDWQILGGVVTTPGFFCAVENIVSRILAQVEVSGTGAELRVMENGVRLIGSVLLSDTVGAWSSIKFYSSDVPTDGTNEYSLEGRLNGASSLKIRFCSMSLLERF